MKPPPQKNNCQNPSKKNMPTCLISPLQAQLYPVGQTTEAFTGSDHPDTGSLSELYWQPSSAMQITTSTWAEPSLALPVHLYSMSLSLGTRTPFLSSTLCLMLLPLSVTRRGLGLKTNRSGSCIHSHDRGLPLAFFLLIPPVSHTCPPAMCTVYH